MHPSETILFGRGGHRKDTLENNKILEITQFVIS